MSLDIHDFLHIQKSFSHCFLNYFCVFFLLSPVTPKMWLDYIMIVMCLLFKNFNLGLLWLIFSNTLASNKKNSFFSLIISIFIFLLHFQFLSCILQLNNCFSLNFCLSVDFELFMYCWNFNKLSLLSVCTC